MFFLRMFLIFQTSYELKIQLFLNLQREGGGEACNYEKIPIPPLIFSKYILLSRDLDLNLSQELTEKQQNKGSR